MYSSQRGNILFLILLAVVLFAALSYAVTSNERGQVKDVSGDKANLIASQIMQYASLVENTITRMRVTGGCNDFQISFENPTVSGYANAVAPADKHCNVFDPAGGGVPWSAPPDGATLNNEQWFFTGAHSFNGVGTPNWPTRCDDVSASERQKCTELAMFLPHIPKSVCVLINSKVNVNPGGNPPIDDMYGTRFYSGLENAKFTGTYSGADDLQIYTAASGIVATSGCYQDDPSDTNYFDFFQILIIR